MIFPSTVFLQKRVLHEISRLRRKRRETGKISRGVKTKMRIFRDFCEIPKSLVIEVLLLRVQPALLLRVQQGRLPQILQQLERLPRQAELFRNLSMATMKRLNGCLLWDRWTMLTFDTRKKDRFKQTSV